MASDSMCVLGIDLGTTSVKVTLLRKECGSVISSISKATKADVVSDVDKGSEQDPTMILDTLKECMAQLSKDHLQQVTCVGVTGQMHGVVLWNSTKSDEWKHLPTSHLYTWQDQRCTTDFLRSLPTPDSHLPLSTGHGCATLCWLHRYKPEMTSAYECSGTIMDLLVALLCGLSVPVTTIQLSASFGFYNTKTRSWNKEILQSFGFPFHVLPNVMEPGSIAGNLQYDWMGIPKGTPVMAALGDVQCAVFSVVSKATDAVLNMSTSGQMMFPVKPDDAAIDKPDVTSSIQYFPYFNGCYLAMAASLNGGNVLSHMVGMLQEWCTSFGLHVPEHDLWLKLVQPSTDDVPGPVSIPTLFGERHLPEQTLSVSGLTKTNFDIGSIFRSLCRGLIDNLCTMMPVSFLRNHGITTVIATGSVTAKNSIIRNEIVKQYAGFQVEFGNSSDSATGVAMFCAQHST